MLARALVKGTQRRDSEAWSRELEGMAAVVDGFCGRNTLGLQFECLSEHGFEVRPGREHWGVSRAHVVAPGGHQVELMAAPPPRH